MRLGVIVCPMKVISVHSFEENAFLVASIRQLRGGEIVVGDKGLLSVPLHFLRNVFRNFFVVDYAVRERFIAPIYL